LILYCTRYQEHGNHDEAVLDCEVVCQKEPSAESRTALREAKRLQKLAKRKDYYKILGLSKNASTDDIKKAYRKNAMLHHPDRHADADDAVKTEEEQIFKEVSEAYTVLSDSKKRSRYDNGQDLDDMGKSGYTVILAHWFW
jgi:DnaJ family protein C protein 7